MLKRVTAAAGGGGGGELLLLIYKSGGNCIIHTHQIKEIAPYKQDLYNSLRLIDPAFIVKVISSLCMCTRVHAFILQCGDMWCRNVSTDLQIYIQ